MPTKPPIHKPFGTETRHERLDAVRGSPTERGYDATWRKFRSLMLSQRPLCEDCDKGGVVTAANEVHHIRKVRDAPELRLVPFNVMCLCKPCHSARTAKGE